MFADVAMIGSTDSMVDSLDPVMNYFITLFSDVCYLFFWSFLLIRFIFEIYICGRLWSGNQLTSAFYLLAGNGINKDLQAAS